MQKAATFKILFLVAVFTGSKDDWIDVFSSPLPRIKGFPKRDKTIKKAIADLLSEKLLEYKNQKDNVLIRPTFKGYTLLGQYYHYYRAYIQKWDGVIRLIAYDVSEKERSKRDALRRILKLAGCGMWQNSLWLSLYSVENTIKKLGAVSLLSSVNIYEVKFLSTEIDALVYKIWDLDMINRQYKEIYDRLVDVVDKKRGKRTRVDIFRDNFLRYQNVLSKDPGVPQELLAGDWYGRKVRQAFIKLQKML